MCGHDLSQKIARNRDKFILMIVYEHNRNALLEYKDQGRGQMFIKTAVGYFVIFRVELYNARREKGENVGST
jgi:hypothetical protein